MSGKIHSFAEEKLCCHAEERSSKTHSGKKRKKQMKEPEKGESNWRCKWLFLVIPLMTSQTKD